MSKAHAPSFSPFEIGLDAIKRLDEPMRSVALEEVAEIAARVKANKLWGFRPHGGEWERKIRKKIPLDGEEHRGQIEYLELNAKDTHIGAVVGGNRFGKTEIGLIDNLTQTLPPSFVPPWLEVYRRRPYDGDFRVRTVVVDLPNALKKVWLPKMRRMIPAGALWKGDFAKAWNERDRLLTFADGSWWDFLTHDMDVDSFSGADVDRVHFDEEPPGSKGYLQFDESTWRIIDRDGDLRFTMTPLLGFSWLFYELTENDLPRKDQEVYVVEGSIDDNPTLSEEVIARQVKRYEKRDPGRLEARRHGRFVHFAGLIYPEFRETTEDKGGHLLMVNTHEPAAYRLPRADTGVNSLGIPTARCTFPIYAVIDPGVDHPAALLFFYVDERDVAIVFYAQKWAQGDAGDMAAEYHRVCNDYNIKPAWVVIDPVAKNRNFTDGRNLQDVMLRDHRILTRPGNNVVGAGLNEVRARLKSYRVLIWADQDQLIDEMRTYRWKTAKNTTEDEPRLEPVKRNDDLVDALRYGLMSLPMAGKLEEKEDPDYNRQEKRLLRENLQRVMRKARGGHARVGSVQR